MPIESINLSTTKKSDFVPTADEIKTIQEKMKDPEFMKLMTEYMTSLEDPAYRAEEEAYLEQVEREAKEGGDNSFDFVFPKPNYFVELGVGKDKEGARVFINMCTSEKIEEYTEETTNRRDASNWTVPVSIGRPRPDTFEGKPACVYDAAFHPKTLSLGDRSDRFMTFLVEIAVENINAGHKRQYGYGFRRMSNSSSTVIAVGIPQNMTVSRPKGSSAASSSNSILNAAKAQSVLTKPTQFHKDGTATLSEAPRPANGSGGTAGYSPSGAASGTTAVTSSSSARASASAAPSAAATSSSSSTTTTAVKAAKEPEDSLPPFTITHRGAVDLLDTWNWKVSDRRTGVPKQLVVTCTFAGVTSAAALEMDVSADGCRIDIHKTDAHPFYGSIALPFTVEDTPASAKFEKKKGILTLVLDVKSTTIPYADLPQTAGGGGGSSEAAAGTDADAEPEPSTASHPIDVKSALPSMSPTRQDMPSPTKEVKEPAAPAPATEKAEEKVAEEAATRSKPAHADPEATLPPAKSLVEEITPAAGNKTDAPAVAPMKATEEAPAPSSAVAAEGFESDANDRMQEVMRKIAEAKRQREEAEAAERAAEEAVREAEAEEAAKAKAAEEEKEKAAKREEAVSAEPPKAEAATEEEPLEVIDLRNQQAEWLKGVTGAAAASNTAEAKADGEEAASFGDAIASAVKAVVKESTGGLLDDDEDEEALEKRREMRRKLREIQRQEDAAREAERLDSLMKQKMAELPLRSGHIFDIE